MSEFKPIKCTENEMPSSIIDGQLIFTTDTNKIYLDNGKTRQEYTKAPIVNHYYAGKNGISSIRTEDIYQTCKCVLWDVNIIKTENYAIVHGVLTLEKTANKSTTYPIEISYGCIMQFYFPELKDITRVEWISGSGTVATNENGTAYLQTGFDETESGYIEIVAKNSSKTDAIGTQYSVPFDFLITKGYINT